MRTNRIIEFTGIPNSGKTTLIRRLKEEFPEKYGLTVQVQREDAEIVPTEIPKRTWNRNVWITFGQLQSLVQAYYSPADIVLLDRGMFDAMFWAKFMLDQKTATKEQADGVLTILDQMYKNLDFRPDCLFLIDSSVEESLRRRALMEGTSVYSKPDFLNMYHEMFFDVFNSYIKQNDEEKMINIPAFYYDTTKMDPDEVFEVISKRIVDLFKN